jgi:DNA-binding GntR family transcriptional regulator
MTTSPIQLDTAPDLVDQVYKALLDAICDGSLAAGQRITQEDIATRLTVSRQPVHQALRQLKLDGLVVDAAGLSPAARGRGVVISHIDPQAMAQIYAVRGSLDALSARQAAQRRAIIDPALIANGRRASKGKYVKAMIEADMAFHEAIYQASGNALISQSARAHWRHIRRMMGAVLQHVKQRDTSWDDHQAIADAIAAGNDDLAAKLASQHCEDACRILTAHLSPAPTYLHKTLA